MKKLANYFSDGILDRLPLRMARTKLTADKEGLAIWNDFKNLCLEYDFTSDEDVDNLLKVLILISDRWKHLEWILGFEDKEKIPSGVDRETYRNYESEKKAFYQFLKEKMDECKNNKNNHEDNDLEQLSPIVSEYIKEIKYKENGGRITNPILIHELFSHINLDEFLDQQSLLLSALSGQQEMRTLNGSKQYFISSIIVPFFNFLNSEARNNFDSQNDIYRFIIRFCEIAGTDWQLLSNQQDLASYLKKTIHTLTNCK